MNNLMSLTLLLPLWLLMVANLAAAQGKLPEAEAISRVIVTWHPSEGDKTHTKHASGFFVSEDHVMISAWHSFVLTTKDHQNLPSEFFSVENRPTRMICVTDQPLEHCDTPNADVVAHAREDDIAILRVRRSQPSPCLSIEDGSAPLEISTSLDVIGFARRESEGGHIYTQIVGTKVQSRLRAGRLALSAQGAPGLSGAPAINRNGRVAGMVREGFRNTHQIIIASAPTILSALRNRGHVRTTCSSPMRRRRCLGPMALTELEDLLTATRVWIETGRTSHGALLRSVLDPYFKESGWLEYPARYANRRRRAKALSARQRIELKKSYEQILSTASQMTGAATDMALQLEAELQAWRETHKRVCRRE